MSETFVRQWLETYNSGNLDRCMECYTDDVEFEDPIFGERVRGKASLRKAFAAFFFSGVTTLRFRTWSGGPEGGAVEWEWTADWGPDRTFLGFDVSNTTFTTRGVSVLQLHDGTIRSQTDYWDVRNALRQMGVLK